MKFWLAKTNPGRNHYSEFIKKGIEDDDWNDPRDQTKIGAQEGDGLFFYSSAHHQFIVGLGKMGNPLLRQSGRHYIFRADYLTDPLPNPVTSAEIEADPLFAPNPERHICFLPGPVLTRYPLTYEEARRLGEMILEKNSEVEGLQETLAEWFSGLEASPEEKEPEAQEFAEGKKVYAVHVRYERDPKRAREAKSKHKENHGGQLPCTVCQFDFYEAYGELGKDFAEVHHAVPLSSYEKLNKRPRALTW
jgi:hypothetical protein